MGRLHIGTSGFMHALFDATALLALSSGVRSRLAEIEGAR
jgi:hypothetical protein